MALKADEKFVKDSLVQYFGGPDLVKAWEGEDPPDIYINIKGKTLAVEITSLSPVSFSQDGTIENRTTQDCFAINLCNHFPYYTKKTVPGN